MITARRFAISVVVTLAVGAVASAHHSFAAYYFEDQSIQVEGTITAVEFKAPHTWVRINGRDESGKEKRYAAEWANPSRLERGGMTKDTLKVADFVRIWGSPSRDPDDGKLHLKRILRPSDGWEWQQGRR